MIGATSRRDAPEEKFPPPIVGGRTPTVRLPALLMLLSTSAFAQSSGAFSRGIDLVPIKLTPGLESGLTLDSAELAAVGSWQLQAMLDFNIGILALKLGDQRLGDLMPFRSDLHLMGAWQVHPRIELSADLPITFLQLPNFDLLTQQGFTQQNPYDAGLGAPRLIGRFQLLHQDEYKWAILGLAATMEVRVPLGDKFSFLSDRGFVFAPRLAVERSIGPVRILGNIGWRFRTAVGQYLNLYVGQEFTLGGGVIIALGRKLGPSKNLELLGDLNVATPAEAPFTLKDADSLKTPFELMIGARGTIGDHWRAQLSFGKGLGANGYGRETFRITLALSYVKLVEPDSDGDGIPDKVDGCPDVPEDKDGYQDEDGCPEENPVADRDGDGVPDINDLCPDTPGPAALQGCPDRDGDQIPDIQDKCPDEPGPPDREGCPPPPEEEDVVLESERIRINNQILFEFGSDRIDPQSFKLLDDVAVVLTKNKDVGPVLIEGHTDNIGPRSINLDLSRRRAKAVETYLVGKGIARERLRSDGFGFDRPIVPNDTPLNRAKNRRTEFKLVEESQNVEGRTPKAKPADAPPAPKKP